MVLQIRRISYLTILIVLGALLCLYDAEAFTTTTATTTRTLPYSKKDVRRRQSSFLSSSSSRRMSSSSTSLEWNIENLDDYANRCGITISLTTLGPGYRAVARAKHDESLILGYVEGFVRPAGQILHLDKMEIFQPILLKAKQQVPNLFDFGGISFGIGLILGYRCLLFAKEKGCSIAEFLAIDDEEFQHKRLVRYYKRVGFQVVKYVGDDVTDIPARMVWGGCGTLMKEKIDVLIEKWANLITLMDERAKKEKTATK